MRGRKTLQMHAHMASLCKHMGNTVGGISLNQRRESTINLCRQISSFDPIGKPI